MIKSIQSLRAIAALCVVLVSCGNWFAAEYPGRFENPFQLGNSGVDLFFIISGFVMLFSIRSAPAMGPGLFVARRIIRIVPLYWFMTTVALSVAILLPQVLTNYRVHPWNALFSYLFVPQDTYPVIRTGWTLSYEMYFYLMLAAFLYAGLRAKLHWLAAVFAISFLLGQALPQYRVYPLFSMLTSELLLEFVMGMLLFHAYEKGIRVSLPAAAVSITVGLLLFSMLDGSTRLLSYGAPMAFICVGVILCRREMLNFRPLHVLGDASYSLYLIQVLVIPACGKIVRKLPIDAYAFSAPLMAVYLTASVAAAVGLYFFFERPVTERLKKSLRKESFPGEPEPAYSLRSAGGQR